uniref:Cys-tRNA(Pro)/Cys-tRNA(Cys) deacylase n=1 Tax=Eubacterium plexicaudatum ASF492 TaxID=1235802 RepID=N2AD69_9FIRM
MKKNEKTNVMRLFDRKKVVYKSHFYDNSSVLSGQEVASVLGQDPQQVFKTLVTVGKSGQHYVFVVPVLRELDLKKAAEAVGEKKIEMIREKELLPLTGYVHGGCSPVGMKKSFPTVVDSSSKEQETIMVSGGKIGCQVELTLQELTKVISFQTVDVSTAVKK